MMKKFCFLFALLALLSSCSNEDTSITLKSPSELSLYVGDQSQIEAESAAALRYGSLDAFCASVQPNGLIEANHVGKTTIKVINGEGDIVDINVVVNPKSKLYVEPYHEFTGLLRSVVESIYGKNFTEIKDENAISYDLSASSDYGQAEKFYFYFQQNRDKKQELYKSAVDLKAGTNEEALKLFLEERYMPDENVAWLYRNTVSRNDNIKQTVFVVVTPDPTDNSYNIVYTTSDPNPEMPKS